MLFGLTYTYIIINKQQKLLKVFPRLEFEPKIYPAYQVNAQINWGYLTGENTFACILKILFFLNIILWVLIKSQTNILPNL